MRWLILDCRVARVKPKIFRHLQVPETISLPRLGKVLNTLFGWKAESHHCFEFGHLLFSDDETCEELEGFFSPEKDLRLVDFFPDGRRSTRPLKYSHEIDGEIEVQLRVLRSGQGRAPIQCLAGEGNAPPLEGPLDLADLAARMQRLFGRRHRKLPPVLSERPAVELDFFPVGRRLESYALDKLTVKTRMIATLLERGQPLGLDEIAARLEQAGASLPEGVTTLRRAWRHDPVLRQRLDGRLEVNKHHPYYWMVEEELGVASGEPASRPTQGPVTLEELENIWPDLSMNAPRRILMVLEALGGRASLTRVKDVVQRLSGALTGRIRSILEQKLEPADENLRGAWRMERSELLLDPHHPELPKVRQQLRRFQAPAEAVRNARIGRGLEHYRNSPQVLLIPDQGDRFRVRNLADKEEYWMNTDREQLERFEAVYAPGAADLYERLQIEPRPTRRLLDLMPYAYDHGGRTYPQGCQLETLIQYTLGCCYPPGAGATAKMPYLACFLSYGNLHGQVQGPYGPVPVWWNLALRPGLIRILVWCIQYKQEVALSYQPRDPLQAQLSLRRFRPLEMRGYSEVRGRFVGAVKDSLLELAQIQACDFDDKRIKQSRWGLEASFMRLDAS